MRAGSIDPFGTIEPAGSKHHGIAGAECCSEAAALPSEISPNLHQGGLRDRGSRVECFRSFFDWSVQRDRLLGRCGEMGDADGQSHLPCHAALISNSGRLQLSPEPFFSASFRSLPTRYHQVQVIGFPGEAVPSTGKGDPGQPGGRKRLRLKPVRGPDPSERQPKPASVFELRGPRFELLPMRTETL